MNVCQLCEGALEDGYLCLGCTKATRVRLEALPVLHRGLGPLLAPAGGSGPGRRGKGGPVPLPVNEEILDLRGPGGIVGTAEGWVDAIRHDRRHRGTAPTGGIEARLAAAVTELTGHLPWVAVSWPDAGEFARDIRELARSISSIIRPPAAGRGTRLGNCPAAFEDGVICGAVLRLAPGERIVTCRWCDTTYPPATWTGLKTLMDEDAKGTQIVGTPGEPQGYSPVSTPGADQAFSRSQEEGWASVPTPGADQEGESWPSAS